MSIEYKCKICNKIYKTYQTLWKHNWHFHDNTSSTNIISNNTSNNTSTDIKQFNCKYCDKNHNTRQSKWYHQQKCKIKNDTKKQTEVQIELLQEKNKIYEEIINKLSLPINHQLINLIEDKNKKIEELQLNKELTTIKQKESVDINSLKEKEEKIKILENIYLKKHKRIEYPENNVIYLLTT